MAFVPGTLQWAAVGVRGGSPFSGMLRPTPSSKALSHRKSKSTTSTIYGVPCKTNDRYKRNKHEMQEWEIRAFGGGYRWRKAVFQKVAQHGPNPQASARSKFYRLGLVQLPGSVESKSNEGPLPVSRARSRMPWQREPSPGSQLSVWIQVEGGRGPVNALLDSGSEVDNLLQGDLLST